jgi:gluconokinase
MGPAGSGKTVVGQRLAAELGWEFLDADDFHSPANRLKMSKGCALADGDRLPWLKSIRKSLTKRAAAQENLVLACSALKQSYRDLLTKSLDLRLIYLRGSREVLLKRLKERKGHFFEATLLDSQLAELEEPTDALTLDVGLSPHQLAQEIRERLNLK